MRANHNKKMAFRGGPLDGQTKVKTRTGRWPYYLAEDGETMIFTWKGDQMRRNGDTALYINTEEMDPDVFPMLINHVYVHVSIYGGTK